MQMSVAEKTKLEIIELTYAQTVRGAVSHAFAITLIALWFSHIAPLSELFVWVAAILVVTTLRIALFYAHREYGNAESASLWMHLWASLFFMLGVIYVYGFIYFTPIDRPEYSVSIGLFVIALSAASMIGYTASFYATLSFFIPIIVPSAFFLFLQGSPAGNVAAFTIVIYGTIALSLMKNSNKAYKKSIFLNFQHKQEIEKRKQIEKQLQDMSRRDSLTGLYNRRYFDEMLNVEIGRANRNKLPLCLIMFDVDCFKEYNDQYGHVSGDNCLIEIGDIAKSYVSRQGDIIARYGGEEFAIILPNIELEGAVSFANKLQMGIQDKCIAHNDTKVTDLKCVTVSAGVTNLILSNKICASALIEDADLALYEAKRQGRNRVHFNENI